MRASQVVQGFPCSLVSEESACNAGNPGSVPGLGGFPGEGNGNPLQHSCLENTMDRGAWQLPSLRSPRVGHDLATKLPPRGGASGKESACECTSHG